MQILAKSAKFRNAKGEFEPSGHATLTQRRINVDATSRRCIDVDTTLYKRHVPAGRGLNEMSHWHLHETLSYEIPSHFAFLDLTREN